jgi:hypothetical protein
VFKYLPESFSQELIIEYINERRVIVGGNEKYAIMDVVDGANDDVPRLAFAVKVKAKSLDGLRENLGCRMRYLTRQLVKAKKEVEKCNIRLAQCTAGFTGIGFDDSRIYVISERKNSLSCFSSCAKGKNKKNCSVF